MDNAKIFELRQRARELGNDPIAKKVMDQMFALALTRVIPDIRGITGLRILIETGDIYFVQRGGHGSDRVIVEDARTRKRMSTGVHRLRKEVACCCYAIRFDTIVQAGNRVFDAFSRKPSATELSQLRSDAENLIAGQPLEVFEHYSVARQPERHMAYA